ncbi:MAG TPA: DUF559 domain-containing protein [Chloroflexota bacterium]|nr:DUF559 domain-containing protein [Chloroflexota bacterium]
MELRQVIWAWETLVARLQHEEPALGRPLGRSVRPLAAERQLDGRLLLVLGCWWAPDLAALAEPAARERLAERLGAMLEDPLQCEVVRWPAGLAPGAAPASDTVPAPDLLAHLPEALRREAARCESPLQRWFYARACMRGLRLHCQYVVGHLRLDFALPRARLAVEVGGWAAPRGPREREEQLGAERWRLLWFSGREVHADADRCVATLLRALPRPAAAPPRPRPAAPRFTRSARGPRARW